jgi:hypothetical protein
MSVNNVKVDIEALSLSYDNLYRPESIIRDRYNSMLSSVFGVQQDLKDFSLDLRGFSSEIAQSKGEYLNVNDVTPYVVIVSPDQASAPLINGTFSFKEEFMRKVYTEAAPAINAVTAHEILWGSITNRVDNAQDVDELLRIDSISLNLDTPLGSIKRIKKLQGMHSDLKSLLLDDSRVNEMIDSHKKLNLMKYGDIRGMEIGAFPLTMAIGSFHTSLFGGTYVLKSKNGTLVVYNDDTKRTSTRDVRYVPTGSKKLMDTLFEEGFIEFNVSDDYLQAAKRSIEDSLMLKTGYDMLPKGVSPDMDERQVEIHRQRGLLKHALSLPNSWYEIHELIKLKENRSSREVIRDYVINCKPETKVKLAQAVHNKDLINQLLSRVDDNDTDFVRMAQSDRERLLQEFTSYSNNKKKYVCYQLTRRD